MKNETRIYPCEIIRVVDGDTLEVKVDAGFRFQFTDNVRLSRINCPEMKTQAGKSAKAWVLSYIMGCKMSGSKFFIRPSKHGKTRYIAEIIVQDYQGVYSNMNDDIVNAGHGVFVK